MADGNFVILSGCRARVDLAFVIDGSGSIEHYGRGNFRRCLNFVKAIVRRFNTDSGQTRIGVVLFSSRPRLIFRFGQYRRKSTILRVISRIRYPRGGTKIGYAMRYTYSRVFRYARKGVRKVIVVLKWQCPSWYIVFLWLLFLYSKLHLVRELLTVELYLSGTIFILVSKYAKPLFPSRGLLKTIFLDSF